MRGRFSSLNNHKKGHSNIHPEEIGANVQQIKIDLQHTGFLLIKNCISGKITCLGYAQNES